MIAQQKTEEELLANSAPCSESLTDEVREVERDKTWIRGNTRTGRERYPQVIMVVKHN